MKLQSSPINETNALEWDNFLIEQQINNPFQSAAFLLALRHNQFYQPFGKFFRNDQGKIVGGYVGINSHETRGIVSSLTTRTIINGGPVVLGNQPDCLNEILADLAVCKDANGIYMELWHDQESRSLNLVYQKNGFCYHPHLNYLIDLSVGKEELWQRIAKRKRRYIKGNFDSVEISPVKDLPQLHFCYDLFAQTYRRIHLPLLDFSVFKDIFKANLGIFLLAKKDGQPVAARVALHFNFSLYDWFAGDNTDHRGLHANESLVWWLFEYGFINGYNVFNFGGAGKPGHPYGPREFKKDFGGNLVEYGRHRLILSPLRYQILDLGIKLRKWIITQKR